MSGLMIFRGDKLVWAEWDLQALDVVRWSNAYPDGPTVRMHRRVIGPWYVRVA
jgi:hypothetical protein